MAEQHPATSKLKAAIIGGGPAGLAAAIEFSKRAFIDWKLYEKKPEISEISNGLTIQRNTWRMLEHLGAARHLSAEDFFRPSDGHYTQHRNGRTGQLVNAGFPRKDIAPHHEPCRAHRGLLQQALLKEVDRSRIRVGRKLTRVTEIASGRLRIQFDDGFTDEVDLLVGADGIRSAVREYAFPEHQVKYTGFTAYRTLVKKSDALKINGLPEAVIFWHGTDAKWVYTCPLGGDDFEITARIREPDYPGRSSWGREASVQRFVDSFSEFSPPVKQLLSLVTKVQQFDFFAGSRLETAVGGQGRAVALIGDASHPLSGAFGAGAGFALEDAHALGGAVEWAASTGRPLAEGLRLFDEVRSPHYKALYGVLDEFGRAETRLGGLALTPREEIEARIRDVWSSKYDWMYYHEVDAALAQAIKDKSAGKALEVQATVHQERGQSKL